MITELSDAVASVSKEVTQHESLKNSPQMQAALVQHRMQEALDKQRESIAGEDLDAVRKLVASPDVGGG